MSTPPLYLYAVVPSTASPPTGTGLEGAAVEIIRRGGLGVLVSSLSEAPVKVSAANLRAHQRVVEESHGVATTLPFRFGVVADSEQALVSSFLASHVDVLNAKLVDFEGLTEMRLTVGYVGEAALRELLSASRHLQRLRESIGRRPEAATYYERIELGEEVAAGLAAKSAKDSDECSQALLRRARVERRLEPSNEQTVLRAAYLLERGHLRGFETEVEELAKRHEGRLEFEMAGPIAPWDFIELERADLGPQATELAGATRSRGRWDS